MGFKTYQKYLCFQSQTEQTYFLEVHNLKIDPCYQGFTKKSEMNNVES